MTEIRYIEWINDVLIAVERRDCMGDDRFFDRLETRVLNWSVKHMPKNSPAVKHFEAQEPFSAEDFHSIGEWLQKELDEWGAERTAYPEEERPHEEYEDLVAETLWEIATKFLHCVSGTER